jgi:nucleotide-binding universal stress UspA family protein
MYERMLVPLDGSKVGEAALPYVEELVSKLTPSQKVEVTLFQVITTLTHYVIAGEASARVPYNERELKLIKRQAVAYLNKAAEGLKNKGASVKCKVVIGRDAAGEIIKIADETNAGLIAMSTHGRSGLSRWAFGSVTEKVLRAGLMPILTVRAPQQTEETQPPSKR